MLTPLEIYNGTRGVLRLLRFDPAGAAFFDNTVEAFWRSFRLMVLVAPVYLLLRVLYYDGRSTTAGDVEIVIVETLRYLIEWFLFPVIMYELAGFLDLRRNYLRYIAALNWMNVPLVLVALAVSGVGEAAPALRPALTIGLELLLFFWFCAITRLVLGAGWGLTLGLCLIWIAPTIILQTVLQEILGLPRT
jgi:hypothetical protein